MGASEPCVIYTDRLAIVLGLRRGREWCGNGKRAHADVWWQIWFFIADREVPVDAVKHCKAHRSRAVFATLEGPGGRAALGNQEVDLVAKQAAELDAGFGRDQAVKEAGQKVAWALHNIGWWHERVND